MSFWHYLTLLLCYLVFFVVPRLYCMNISLTVQLSHISRHLPTTTFPCQHHPSLFLISHFPYRSSTTWARHMGQIGRGNKCPSFTMLIRTISNIERLNPRSYSPQAFNVRFEPLSSRSKWGFACISGTSESHVPVPFSQNSSLEDFRIHQ